MMIAAQRINKKYELLIIFTKQQFTIKHNPVNIIL